VLLDERPTSLDELQEVFDVVSRAWDRVLTYMFIDHPDFAPESPFSQTE
jgi:hypothetical protein